jgi:hypothetical protein
MTEVDLLAAVKERSLAEGSVATRRELDQLIRAASDPWHCRMLTTLRDHWWLLALGHR